MACCTAQQHRDLFKAASARKLEEKDQPWRLILLDQLCRILGECPRLSVTSKHITTDASRRGLNFHLELDDRNDRKGSGPGEQLSASARVLKSGRGLFCVQELALARHGLSQRTPLVDMRQASEL
jgi:hypothetical protein